jgi:hypothetical protein
MASREEHVLPGPGRLELGTQVAAHPKINIRSTSRIAGDADAFNCISTLRLLMI